MGGGSSSPSPPRYVPAPYVPPPAKLTAHPWRKTASWDKELENALLMQIKKLNPQEKPNLQILGPVGAGKSSFINSILSIGKGRKCINAPAGEQTSSYTVEFDRYTEKSLLQKYRLFDCMGIEPSDGHGFHQEDIIALLTGHMKRNYSFNPAKPISETDSHYRKNPKLEHETHCVIFVVDAMTIHSGIPPAYVQKIGYLQDKIKRQHIPRILILTKVDKLCDEVERDITKLFMSVKVRDVVKTAGEVFGIDLASIHPVKNYEVEFEIEPMTNIPLLLALRQTMQYADDRIDYVLEQDTDSDSD